MRRRVRSAASRGLSRACFCCEMMLEMGDGGWVLTYRLGFLGTYDRCVGVHVCLIEIIGAV